MLVLNVIIPLRKKIAYVQNCLKGDFSDSLNIGQKDELGILAERIQQLSEDNKLKEDYLNNLPTPVVAIDKEVGITFINSTGAKVLNKEKTDILGKKCYNIFNTTHCNNPECRCAQAMQKDGTFTGETIANLPSGAIPIRYTAAPMKDASGKITGALEFIADHSEVRGALKDSMLKVEYLNNIPTPVMVIDIEFNVKFMESRRNKSRWTYYRKRYRKEMFQPVQYRTLQYGKLSAIKSNVAG